MGALWAQDAEGYFREPVTEDVAPGYFKVISRPMCLRQMRERVLGGGAEGGGYATLRELREDFELICSNAASYNQKRSRVHKAAQTFLRNGRKTLRDMELAVRKELAGQHPGGREGAAAAERAGKPREAGLRQRAAAGRRDVEDPLGVELPMGEHSAYSESCSDAELAQVAAVGFGAGEATSRDAGAPSGLRNLLTLPPALVQPRPVQGRPLPLALNPASEGRPSSGAGAGAANATVMAPEGEQAAAKPEAGASGGEPGPAEAGTPGLAVGVAVTDRDPGEGAPLPTGTGDVAPAAEEVTPTTGEPARGSEPDSNNNNNNDDDDAGADVNGNGGDGNVAPAQAGPPAGRGGRPLNHEWEEMRSDLAWRMKWLERRVLELRSQELHYAFLERLE